MRRVMASRSRGAAKALTSGAAENSGRLTWMPLRMRLSSSLPNDPKYANGRTFSDLLQKMLGENGLGEQIGARDGKLHDEDLRREVQKS